MITSVNNGQVKNIIQLNQKTKARREQGLFVAEGRKMFGEAPRDWISKVYVSEALSGANLVYTLSFCQSLSAKQTACRFGTVFVSCLLLV